MKSISFSKVSQNNLKKINFKIPLKSFCVVCGPSGSGKSSLAFDTLFAEGQRRYIESLSNYTKQFFKKAPKPEMEGADNIPPAIAIEQKNSIRSSRSTVGTSTEIFYYIRLLYEKLGVTYCPKHKKPLKKNTPSTASEQLIKAFDGERGYVLFPLREDVLGKNKKTFIKGLLHEGYLRVFLKTPKNHQVLELEELLKKKKPRGEIFLIVDRVAFGKKEKGRLSDSIRNGFLMNLRYGTKENRDNLTIVTTTKKEMIISSKPVCPTCGYNTFEVTAQHLNFNSSLGACIACNGFGSVLKVDEKKVIPQENFSIQEGAIKPFTMPSGKKDQRRLIKFCEKRKINVHTPWKNLPERHRKLVWGGDDTFYGVQGVFDYLESRKHKMYVRIFLARHKSPFICNQCKGVKLKSFAKHIYLSDKNICDIAKMSIKDLETWFSKLNLTKKEKDVSGDILEHICSHLNTLVKLGIGYLTLDRETKTLSGGECQRISLCKQLGSKLSQTLYVLDEPTIGLHPRDNESLINVMKEIRNLGNTLVVVEHDLDVIQNSDYVIEMGPQSGAKGGEIIYSGKTEDFYKFKKSNTSSHLKKKGKDKTVVETRKTDMKKYKYKLSLRGCTGNNLKNVHLEIPLNRIVSISGVSGSGKSSLITQTLYPALVKELSKENPPTGLPYKILSGAEYLKDVFLIDQSPTKASIRSNPATYLQIYSYIRHIMGFCDDAVRGDFTPTHFSLNTEGGRCPTCKGVGYETIDMVFMDDIEVSCGDCKGKRFKKDVLDIFFRGKNILDILNMTVEESLQFFQSSPQIRIPLFIMKEIGLGYIKIGQSIKDLSGGEIQRLKIARKLCSNENKNHLFIMDEPTKGLHFNEVHLLIKVLDKLVDSGNSVLLIEHNQEILRHSDHIIDMGPDAGKRGGEIVYQGSVGKILKSKNSLTGIYLKKYL